MKRGLTSNSSRRASDMTAMGVKVLDVVQIIVQVGFLFRKPLSDIPSRAPFGGFDDVQLVALLLESTVTLPLPTPSSRYPPPRQSCRAYLSSSVSSPSAASRLSCPTRPTRQNF